VLSSIIGCESNRYFVHVMEGEPSCLCDQ
jgi:hypothetical protein